MQTCESVSDVAAAAAAAATTSDVTLINDSPRDRQSGRQRQESLTQNTLARSLLLLASTENTCTHPSSHMIH